MRVELPVEKQLKQVIEAANSPPKEAVKLELLPTPGSPISSPKKSTHYEN